MVFSLPLNLSGLFILILGVLAHLRGGAGGMIACVAANIVIIWQ
jgi:hypothetical protein